MFCNAVLCRPLNLQRSSGLNSNDYPGWRGFENIVPLNAFMAICCTEADTVGLRIHTVFKAILHSSILLHIMFIFLALCHWKVRVLT